MFCPFLPEHYQMSVLESAPVSSTVGRVFAKDLDEGVNAEMKYSIVDGDGADAFDINTDPSFQVGIITVRKVTRPLFPNRSHGGCAGTGGVLRAVVLLTGIASNLLIMLFPTI